MARWGEGIYDDSVALDVRARFQSTLAEGRSPGEAARWIARDLPVGDGTDRRHVSILALADLIVETGAEVPEITSEAIEGVDKEMRLTSPVPERLAILEDLRRRLIVAGR